MPKYEALRDWNIGYSGTGATYHIHKGNIYELPNDYINQRRLNVLMGMKNPVFRAWKE